MSQNVAIVDVRMFSIKVAIQSTTGLKNEMIVFVHGFSPLVGVVTVLHTSFGNN